jgi:hypothetical protein
MRHDLLQSSQPQDSNKGEPVLIVATLGAVAAEEIRCSEIGVEGMTGAPVSLPCFAA